MSNSTPNIAHADKQFVPDYHFDTLASEQKLLMMRPHQIYTVKNIVQTIHQNSGNRYIDWTTLICA